MESVSIKAAMVLPALIFQKPFKTSKSKDHVACIERRLKIWKDGQFCPLMDEAKDIQMKFIQTATQRCDESVSISHKFSDLMKKGKVKQALCLISEDGTRVLSLDEMANETCTVRGVLWEKHPDGHDLLQEVISHPVDHDVHPIIFEEIDCASILKSALHTDGGAGPSGLNAYAWKRMCSFFQKASLDICAALALTARRISSSYVDAQSLKPLTLCRLVALNKCPGVRPIGIGEVPRRS